MRGRPQRCGGFVFRSRETRAYLWDEEKTSGRGHGEGIEEPETLLGGRRRRQERSGLICGTAPLLVRHRKEAKALERFMVDVGLFMEIRSPELYSSGVLVTG